MTKVYLIRHAEAEGNYYRRAHGHYNSALTDNGRAQLPYLAKRFETIRLDAVYCSDLTRSRDTAAAVAAVWGLTPIVETGIREMGIGVWEDIPWGTLRHDFPEEMRKFNYDPVNWHTEGAESALSVQERMWNTICAIAGRHEDGTVAMVSHGAAIRMLLARINATPSNAMRWDSTGENTNVSLLLVEGDSIRTEYQGDCSHIPPELSAMNKQKWWKSDGCDIANARLRPWSPETEGELHASLYREAWERSHGNAPFDPAPYLANAVKKSRRDPTLIMVALDGDKPMGLVEMDDEKDAEDGAGHISFIAMTEKYRGKGASPILLGEPISRYRRMGREKLRLCVAPDNTRAIGYYRRQQFAQVGTVMGALAPILVMERSILV